MAAHSRGVAAVKRVTAIRHQLRAGRGWGGGDRELWVMPPGCWALGLLRWLQGTMQLQPSWCQRHCNPNSRRAAAGAHLWDGRGVSDAQDVDRLALRALVQARHDLLQQPKQVGPAVIATGARQFKVREQRRSRAGAAWSAPPAKIGRPCRRSKGPSTGIKSARGTAAIFHSGQC